LFVAQQTQIFSEEVFMPAEGAKTDEVQGDVNR
jgi:hypothetical protein